MNNILKKTVAIVTTVTCAVWMMGPGVASAVTAEELQAQIDTLLAQLTALQAQLAALEGEAPAIEGCLITSFDQNLKQGMSGDDVNCLQIVLNSDPDTQLAAEGVGSPGNETSYFGPLTKAAVIKFQEKYTEDVLAPWGLTEGTGFVGSTTRAKLNELLVVVPEECTTSADCPTGYICVAGECVVAPVVGEGLTVTLAADTPTAGTVVASSSAAELARLTFTNGDSSEAKVTNLKLKRIGISDDTTLVNVYLFDGYTRLGDESTLASGYVSFNVTDGIFTVPAGESKTISVRADIKGGVSGQTVGIELEAADDVTTDATSVNGTFPLTGNLMSVASATTLGTVTLSTTYPNATASIDAVADFEVWRNTLTVTNQDVSLEYLRLTQIGSISAGDLDNIRLTLAGTEIATSELVAGIVGQDLIFDLSDSPVAISKGQTKTLTVYADIVGGATKTMRLGLEKKVDIFVKDASYGCYLTVAGTAPFRTETQTISEGTITMTKATDSPSANVVNTASNVSLAKFNVKANGEEIKINTLKVFIYTNNTSTYSFRNGFLLLDGVQVGNVSNIRATSTAASTDYYTSFSIYQKIAAGTTKVLEVKADVYGCNDSACTSNVATSTNTLQVKVIGSATEDNAQGMVSLSMIDAPAATAEANSLTIGAAELTLVKNAAYGNQSVAPGSDTKLGSYNLMAGAYDTVNISGFTVGVGVTGGTSLSKLSNIYLVYDTNTTAAKGTVAASNVFSVTTSLAPSKTMKVQVWATIDSSVASGTASTTLAVTATKATDGSDVSVSAVEGQTITIASGLVSAALASDTPDSAIIVGQSASLLLAKYTFSALYEAFTVSEANIGTYTSNNAIAFDTLYLKYKNAAGEIVASDLTPLVNGTSTFTGLTMNVPNGGSADLSVYANVNAVAASGYATSGGEPMLTLKYWKAYSGSIASYTTSTDVTSSQMLLYKTQPTVALSGGVSGSLVNGVNTLYKFTVGADAKGDVGLKKITFYVSGGMQTSTDEIGPFTFWRGSLDITDKVAIGTTTDNSHYEDNSLAGDATDTVVVTFDSEEVITADTSQTYYLKATVSGVGTVGENVQTYIMDDASLPTFDGSTSTLPGTLATWAVASSTNFVWSDRHVPAYYHSENSEDWTSGYLVDTLVTETYTISK